MLKNVRSHETYLFFVVEQLDELCKDKTFLKPFTLNQLFGVLWLTPN